MFTNFYELAAYFLVYAFIGWIVEVVYHVVAAGNIINRGFLNGPLCPIYGCGMVTALWVLSPVMDSTLLLFIGGMFLTTFIELVGGWALDKLFHMRWWDYSKEPMNLGGYICVKFALAWGFGVVFVMKLVNPPIDSMIKITAASTPGKIIIILLLIVLFLDLFATVITILNFNKQLETIDKIGMEIHRISDTLTEGIGEASLTGAQKIGEARVQATLGKAELSDKLTETKTEVADMLNNTRDELILHRDAIVHKLTAHKIFGYGRILAAFPGATHRVHTDVLEKLKKISPHNNHK